MSFKPVTTDEALMAYRSDLEKLGLSESTVSLLIETLRPQLELVNRTLDNLGDLVPISMSKEEIEAWSAGTQGWRANDAGELK